MQRSAHGARNHANVRWCCFLPWRCSAHAHDDAQRHRKKKTAPLPRNRAASAPWDLVPFSFGIHLAADTLRFGLVEQLGERVAAFFAVLAMLSAQHGCQANQ